MLIRVGLCCVVLAAGAFFSACKPGSSTGSELIAVPPSLSFSGIEPKTVTFKWGGFSKVVVANVFIGGKNASSFEVVGGNCEKEPIWSGKPTCEETVKLKEAKKGLSAELVLEDNFGKPKVPLSS